MLYDFDCDTNGIINSKESLVYNEAMRLHESLKDNDNYSNALRFLLK